MLSRAEVAARIMQLPPDQQVLAAKCALELYGPADTKNNFEPTRYDPATYIEKRLGWKPWSGENGEPGQQEVLDAYVLALRQMHEREAFEAGEVSEEDLQFWKPGQVIKNRVRIEAGHTVGKTKLASGIVNHFFDHFTPSIGYCFAPGWKQIHDLLFKEIKTDRRGKGLPGRILDLGLVRGDNHFISGKATNNSHGKGSERVQGQHGKYLIFVLDEAEGIPEFVFNAVDSMASGGIVIVIMLANPQTRTSRFHKLAAISTVQSYRISCIHHPNVVAGREVVPGAVKRQYVEEMIEKHCELTERHEPDDYTFELAFPVQCGEIVHSAGTIFKPNAEFMFRVLGVAPANIADNTLVPVGRYEAACKRAPVEQNPTVAYFGVDVSRWGKDFGTLYIRHNGRVWRAAQFWKQDTNDYARVIKEEALKLAEAGVTKLHVRVDGGGGFGGGVIDKVKVDLQLIKAIRQFEVIEVHFNGTPSDGKSYADLITELHGEAAESIKGLAIIDAPEALEADLCERQYKWMNRDAIDVKKLEPKVDFRKRIERSPDDGDGFVMAVASERLFNLLPNIPMLYAAPKGR